MAVTGKLNIKVYDGQELVLSGTLDVHPVKEPLGITRMWEYTLANFCERFERAVNSHPQYHSLRVHSEYEAPPEGKRFE